MLKKDFQKEIDQALKSKPKNWRNGQFVFNYIDDNYRVARYVQFINGVDCFYDDENIEAFIVKCYENIMKAEEYKNIFNV